jgi:hypothetical protein
MEEIYYWITSRPWMFFVLGILVFSIVGFFRRQKHADIIRQKQLLEREDAAAKKIQITNQTGGAVVVHNDGTMEASGETEYKGTTNGIQWELISKVLAVSRDADDRPGRQNTDAWKRSTRLNIESVKLPSGKFLMLMSAPGYNSANKQVKKGGFLNKLVNFAAEFALDIYVAGYFGTQYKSLVGLDKGSEKIDRQCLNDFLILTNDKMLGEKFLDEETTTFIADWKKQRQGFLREHSVDHFGLLFAPDTMVLGCQTNMASAQEVKVFSDFACELASRMKAISKVHVNSSYSIQ